jgi:hypothetical protein
MEVTEFAIEKWIEKSCSEIIVEGGSQVLGNVKRCNGPMQFLREKIQ